MKSKSISPTGRKQRGAATLLTTTVMLIGITLLTVNSSKMGSLELVLSSNHESEKIAFNQSESALDALYVVAPGIIDWNKPEDHVYCTINNSEFSDCDEDTIIATNDWPVALTTNKHQGRIEIERKGCAPRYLDTTCSGSIMVGHYSLTSNFNNTANYGGRSATVVGAMEILF